MTTTREFSEFLFLDKKYRSISPVAISHHHRDQKYKLRYRAHPNLPLPYRAQSTRATFLHALIFLNSMIIKLMKDEISRIRSTIH